MAMVSFRISDEEKTALSSFARLHGTSISNAAREIIAQRIEDEEDTKDYLEYKKNKNGKTFSHKDLMKEFGL